MSKNETVNKNNKTKFIILAFAAVFGIVLLLVGGDSLKSNENEEISAETEVPDAKEFEKEVEEKIIKLCEGVRGAGRVSVVVTLGSGYNAVYAQNSQSSGSGYRNEFVLFGNGSNEKPLVVGYTSPRISGIGIVCSGGGDESVRFEIISLVSATFEVSANKIYVTQSQN